MTAAPPGGVSVLLNNPPSITGFLTDTEVKVSTQASGLRFYGTCRMLAGTFPPIIGSKSSDPLPDQNSPIHYRIRKDDDVIPKVSDVIRKDDASEGLLRA